jgi:hypothetical protein
MVLQLRAVRETIVSAVTALDRILPPLASTQPAQYVGDAKLSIIVDPPDSSPAFDSIYNPGASNRKGKRKIEGGEGSFRFGSSGNERSPQNGRSTLQLVDESRRPSPLDVNAGVASSRGGTGSCPPKPLATRRVTSIRPTKRNARERSPGCHPLPPERPVRYRPEWPWLQQLQCTAHHRTVLTLHKL